MRRRIVVLLAVALSDVAAARADWRDHLTLTAQDRARAEVVDFFRPPPGSAAPDAHRYAFYGNQLRVGLRALFPHLDVVVEGQDTRLVHLPDDASLPPPFGNLGPGAIYFAHTHDRDQG